MKLRRGMFRNTLQAAVILSVFLGLALPALAVFFIERARSIQDAREDLERDLLRTTQVLALSMRAPLWDLSRANAEAIVRAMVDDERFVSVTVLDLSNTQPFVELHRLAGATRETRRAEYNIEEQGKVIGKVNVTMTIAPYLAASEKSLRWAMLRTAFMLIVALILIVFVLQRRLLRPISHLTAAANQLARGDFDLAIDSRHRDELGRVAAAMEHMRQALLAAFAELKRKNEELAAHANSLEGRVEERTHALTQANQELRETLEKLRTTQQGLIESEKLASLGRLVAGVAHELNTPLGNALIVVTTMEDRLEDFRHALVANSLKRSDLLRLTDTLHEGQGVLRRNVERASDLIRDFKQLAIDQTSDKRRSFDLEQLIREVLVTVQPRFKTTPFRLESRTTGAIPMDSYPGPLGQVITNLVINALVHAFDARSEGRVLIEVARDTEDMVRVRCRDDGIGMSADITRKIFDPFFTTKLGQGGSGLGLHIVHNIVTGLLGGSIEVDSKPGEGTCFELRLPLIAPHPGEPGAKA